MKDEDLHQTQPKGGPEKIICYCHGYTESDIMADVKRNKGNSLIMRQIVDARESNACQCTLKHPQKR